MIRFVQQLSIVGAALFLTVPGPSFAQPKQANPSSGAHKIQLSRRVAPAQGLTGLASFYRLAGVTSSGEHFATDGLTAAHPTLPFNTRVKVTCLKTGRSVVVRINDRGPFKKGRVIDVSHGAAKVLGMENLGLTRVSLEVLL
jgi:rare lipoprotein A